MKSRKKPKSEEESELTRIFHETRRTLQTRAELEAKQATERMHQVVAAVEQVYSSNMSDLKLLPPRLGDAIATLLIEDKPGSIAPTPVQDADVYNAIIAKLRNKFGPEVIDEDFTKGRDATKALALVQDHPRLPGLIKELMQMLWRPEDDSRQ